MARAHEAPSFETAARDGAATEAGATFTCSGASTRIIDLCEPQQVSAWTACLGCTEERLRLAIAAVGPEVEEVCNHLGALLPARALSLMPGNGTAH